MKILHIILAIANIFLVAKAHNGIDLSRGLGKGIKWMTLDDGLREAELKSKPLFLLIHKSWCGACKNLKPKLAESKQFKMYSHHFVMVNALDDEEPKDDKYFPDGGYIPRILFLNHLGEVQEQIYNKGGNPKYRFFYIDAETVVKSMEQAIEELQIHNLELEDYKDELENIEEENRPDLSRGFGNDINWMTLEEGLQESFKQNKPLFFLSHKEWCGACQKLKPLLAESKLFKAMSKNFIMVNVADDEEPTDKKYYPDGNYIPRILFLDTIGNHLKITNEVGNPKFKYYYTNVDSVIDSMARALQKLEKENLTYDEDDDFLADIEENLRIHDEF